MLCKSRLPSSCSLVGVVVGTKVVVAAALTMSLGQMIMHSNPIVVEASILIGGLTPLSLMLRRATKPAVVATRTRAQPISDQVTAFKCF